MSSSNRTTAKGGKGSKADNKSHKTDKSDSGKGSDKQQTGRDAGKSEDPSIKDKVRQLIEMSQRSEEEVCLALHECDNDMNLAINMLLENMGHGEWETRVKKKKNRQASASKQDGKGTGGGGNNDNAAADDDWGIEDGGASQQTGGGGFGGKSGGGGGGAGGGDKDRSRNNKGGGGGGGPPRLHGRHNDSRGWRGREKQENERNLEDGGGGGGGRSDYNRGDRERRGRGGGGGGGGGGLGGGSSTRGGGRGGRGGGRTGGGRYPPRGNRSAGGGGGGGGYNKPIDTWDNSNNTWDNNTVAATNHTESWDDFPGPDEWTTEEYTGSLTETKVFTPSVQTALDAAATESSAVVGGVGAGGGASVPPQAPVDGAVIINAAGQQQQTQNNMRQATPNLPAQSTAGQLAGGTLDAAQTQYLTQLTQQNSDNIKQYGSAQTFHAQNSTQQGYGSSPSGPATQTYGSSQQQQQYGTTQNAYVNSSYSGVTNAYPAGVDQQPTQQPVRTKTQRARVPPPSKIPSSAVEMPGDLNSSIGYLDVQFGAMDFMSDGGSFDGGDVGKYGSQVGDNSTVTVVASNIDLGSSGGANQGASPLDAYTPKNTQNSISSLSQSLTSTDNSIPQSNDLTGGYNTAAAPRTTGSSATPSSVTPSGLDLNKQGDSHSYGQQSTYNSYQNKSNTYNSSTYSGTQQTTSSYVSNQANNSYVNSQATPYNTATGNAYQNAYSSSAASYQSNANAAAGYPSISQANNSYHQQQQQQQQQAASNNAAASPYQQQNSTQSVYGGNSGASNTGSGGLNSSSANYVGNANATSQYNSYSSSASGGGSSGHKLVAGGGGGGVTGKDSTYDNSSNVSNVVSSNAAQNTSAQASNSNVTSSTSAHSLSQATVSVTKSTTTLAAKNSSSVVSNIPPGVAPVMSTPYIMGQVPYFQPPVYSYEEVQMLQQRLPHMTTPYYDMSYQTPTTLAAVRDASLGNVGYSISSDGRFTRGDNNASPVPSTLSQQTSTLTQGHQAQPILAGTAPPYFFTAAFNTLTPNYQFGTMYTQMPAATNAHGSSNSTQYPKPGTYGSGYGSYDALSQTQDYNKTGYNVGNNQGQKGAGVNATSSGSSGNDLSAMYGKSHAALGKVNSYDKQGFHSGTPPPFTGALHGGQNAGLAPSNTGYAPQVYIPTMNPHQQQLSTQLMHQPLHQMDVRHHGRRVDSGNSSGQRSQASNQAKGGAKQPYQNSYWNQA